MIKKLFRAVVLILALLAAYLLLWPVAITPAVWTPAPAPELSGPYAQNSQLAGIQRLDSGGGYAPEDVSTRQPRAAFMAALKMAASFACNLTATHAEVFANTAGSHLG